MAKNDDYINQYGRACDDWDDTKNRAGALGGCLFRLLVIFVVCGLLYKGCVWAGSVYLNDVQQAQSEAAEANP